MCVSGLSTIVQVHFRLIIFSSLIVRTDKKKIKTRWETCSHSSENRINTIKKKKYAYRRREAFAHAHLQWISARNIWKFDRFLWISFPIILFDSTSINNNINSMKCIRRNHLAWFFSVDFCSINKMILKKKRRRFSYQINWHSTRFRSRYAIKIIFGYKKRRKRKAVDAELKLF